MPQDVEEWTPSSEQALKLRLPHRRNGLQTVIASYRPVQVLTCPVLSLRRRHCALTDRLE
jgi:hypothetical protein